jgi:(R,R)-butanediol dehydrogenase / meso-butanediol dehydrogenase / diacetyl reductase
MRAAVTNGRQGFDVVEMPYPTAGLGELVIRVVACGVCGSDIKAQPFAPAGMVMGHEFGGSVVAVGAGAGKWDDDTSVAVLPVISCGNCRYCTAGFVSHCAGTSYIGMGPPGGFAEFAVVPARHAFAMPPGVPGNFSALVEPFAVGLHAVHSAEVRAGEEILVVGAGGVGLTTIAWLSAKGAGRITVADPDGERRSLALTMGATDTIASVADAEPASYDAAIECVGFAQLPGECQGPLRPRGRLVIAGACAEPTPIEPITALLKELTIRYSVAYRPDEFRSVIEAFANGSVNPKPMIGPALGLHRMADAFDLVRTGGVQGRVLVTPEEQS